MILRPIHVEYIFDFDTKIRQLENSNL